jgi:uncharacterized radical SAM superfamily Fe-S cluster-containing enzyme
MKVIAPVLIIILLLACKQSNENKGSFKVNGLSIFVKNKMEVNDNNYCKYLSWYITAMGTDTSDFSIQIRDVDRSRALSLCLDYAGNKRTAKERWQELETTMKVLQKTEKLDSIKQIQVGRLITLGDDCVDLSKEILQKNTIASLNNNKQLLNNAIMQSSLANKLNAILQPYNLRLNKVQCEVLTELPKDYLIKYCKLNTKVDSIANNVLDTYLVFECGSIN